jgi:hypothetical protein
MVDRQPYTFDRVIRILFGVVSIVGLFYTSGRFASFSCSMDSRLYAQPVGRV